jgi:alkylation response protein AidB-like acyl-CoA dehydrogenase
VNADDLIERLDALVPTIAGRARRAEELRCLPHETVRDLRESEVFPALVPRRLGGHGLPFTVLPRIGRTLGRGCASTAWVTTFYVMHNWLLAQFPDAVRAEVFADQPYALAPAALSPSGRAEPVDGGYHVSGRWSWGTGASHADRFLVTGVVPAERGPDLRMMLLDPEQVVVEDVWHTDGMRATGSNDVVAAGVFVAAERTVPFLGMVEGEAAAANGHPEEIFRLPLVPALCFTAAAPLIGAAEGALAAFHDRLRERVLAYSLGERQAEKPAAQIRLARAGALIRSSTLLLDDAVDTMTTAYRAGGRIPRRERSGLRMAACHAVDTCKQAVNLLCDGAGGSAHLLDSPLQRFQRDLNTGSGHTVFDYDRTAELHGKLALGAEPGPADML